MPGLTRATLSASSAISVSVNNLGILLQDQGKLDLAEPFLRRAVTELVRLAVPDYVSAGDEPREFFVSFFDCDNEFVEEVQFSHADGEILELV